MSRNLAFYVVILVLFGAGTGLLLNLGSRLQQSDAPSARPAATQAAAHPATEGKRAAVGGAAHALVENARSPLSILL
ncbi:MAG TPA: hypothetical protein VIJ36_09370, partial [Thermoanaerobaculia bacterium]